MISSTCLFSLEPRLPPSAMLELVHFYMVLELDVANTVAMRD
jgi:hypothetical protein